MLPLRELTLSPEKMRHTAPNEPWQTGCCWNRSSTGKECLERRLLGGEALCQWRNFNLIAKNKNLLFQHTSAESLEVGLTLQVEAEGTPEVRKGREEKTDGLLTFLQWEPCKQQLGHCSSHWFFRGRYSAPTDLHSWRFNHIEWFCSTSPLCASPANKTNTKSNESWQRR